VPSLVRTLPAMKTRTLHSACIGLIVLAVGVVPAFAQLTRHVNEDGSLLFTNEDSPAKRSMPAKPAAAAGPAVSRGPGSANSGETSLHPAASAVKSVPVRMAPEELNRVVQASAEKNHVDPALVRAVIRHESNWNSSAVSPKGALGLMQLIPGTAQRLGVGNAFDPVQNVDAGTRYLGMLLARYNGDLSKALAAYNAGPGVVDRFGGVPNYRETRNYVQRVTSTYFESGSDRRSFALFAPRRIYRAADADGRIVFTNE
jgi:hypothetical protein